MCVGFFSFLACTDVFITIGYSLYWTNLYIDVLAPLFVQPIRQLASGLQQLGRNMFSQSSRRKFFARAGHWASFYFPGASMPDECVCCCDLRFIVNDSSRTMCPPEPEECTTEHYEAYWMERMVSSCIDHAAYTHTYTESTRFRTSFFFKHHREIVLMYSNFSCHRCFLPLCTCVRVSVSACMDEHRHRRNAMIPSRGCGLLM